MSAELWVGSTPAIGTAVALVPSNERRVNPSSDGCASHSTAPPRQSALMLPTAVWVLRVQLVPLKW